MTTKDESRDGDLDPQDHANSEELLGNAEPEDRLRSTRHQHGNQSLPRHLIPPSLAFAFAFSFALAFVFAFVFVFVFVVARGGGSTTKTRC